MSIKPHSKERKFEPVTLEITFETQKELDAFGKLTNFAPLTDVFRELGLNFGESFLTLRDMGADLDITQLKKKLQEYKSRF